MKVAVVGAGIMGACTALQLAIQGHEVTIFDQFHLGHTHGSSHGASRIIRKAYPDPFFTEIMQEGYGLWRQLESDIQSQIVHETGLVYFGDRRSPTVRSMVSGLQSLGVAQFELSPSEAKWAHPLLELRQEESAYFTYEAGWVDAAKSIKGANTKAVGLGAKLVQHKVENLSELLAKFDRVVVCAGSWAKEFFNLDVKVTLQTYGYLQLPEPITTPVWIDDNEHNVYGFPSEPGRAAIKFGVHSSTLEVEPNDHARPQDDESREILRAFAQSRFGIADPMIEDFTTCLYTRTQTEDFIWGEPEPRLFFVSACSGHGFKFGPWIGKQLANAVLDSSALHAYPRFVLD